MTSDRVPPAAAGRKLAGRRPFRSARDRARARGIVSLACVFIAVGGLIITVKERDCYRMGAEGLVAKEPGVVTDTWFGNAPYVRVDFSSATGARVRTELASWVGHPRVGDRVPVRYWPANPTLARDARRAVPWWRVLGTGLLVAAGGAWLMAVAWSLWPALWRPWRVYAKPTGKHIWLLE